MIAEDKKFIGQKIRQQRKRLKLTQFELAEKIGIHEKQLSRIEAGLHYPTLENFIKIIKTLNISLREFEENKEINPLKDDINQILNDSNNKELKIYRDVIKSIKDNLWAKYLWNFFCVFCKGNKLFCIINRNSKADTNVWAIVVRIIDWLIYPNNFAI